MRASAWSFPMDDLERGMLAVRDGLVPEWDAERSARVFAGVGQLRRRRAVQRAGVLGAGIAVCAVAVFAGVDQLPRGAAPEAATARGLATPPATVRDVAAVNPAPVAPVATAVAPVVAEADGALRLTDGSIVESIDGAADVRIVRDEASRVELELVAGHARFDVVRRPSRSFEVAVGAWRVFVVGTRFDVQRSEGGVRVSVERGLVRVRGPGGSRELAAGASAWFVVPSPARVRTPVAPRGEAEPDWRQLAQKGDHDAAYRMLQAGARVDDDPWSLMDAADAARLSGHPDGAVRYLDRVVRDYATSPVAPLAAFTLGRIALDRLGRPHDAAQAFASARALAPAGSLAQDALAREVEAWSKAGDVEKAYRLAQEYVTTYPDGPRRTAVRRYGGLEKIE
jgi:transmembrane sensor